MWSDNDIDKAFQRLNPPEPEPTPFPLDAWLRLETELDKAVIERAVRRRLWRFFAAEVAVVALLVVGWLLWPAGATHLPGKTPETASADITSATHQAKPSQLTSVSNSAITDVKTHVTTLLSNTKAASASAAAKAANDKANEIAQSEPAAPLATTIAAAPMAKLAPHTAASRFSAVVGAVPSRRQRKTTESATAFPGIAAPQTARINSRSSSFAHSGSFAHSETTAAQTSVASKATGLQAGSSASLIAQNADPHSAAGSLAAPTEASAEAVVADAASQRPLRRESQSPLLDKAAILTATPGNEASATGAPDASASTSATADVALVPNAVRPSSVVPAALPAPLASVVEAPANLPATVRQPRFYIGLVAAPDVTTVKFVDVERPMLNLGVVLEYRLTNRLRVSTGLLRAKKQYYARREDYDWTNYPRAQTRDFSWVDGACTVVDVPLNLRYDAVVRPQARLFGSVGLSSFFMQRENYSYDYLEDGTYKTWNIPGLVNENRHLFSVLNLSIGYEHQLGTHWRLQAEPYVKLPLAGVGAGKVQLTSGGVFFGVKYGF